jgi:hypothetical protein
MISQPQSSDSSAGFGHVCEWFSVACAAVLLLAFAHSPFESTQERGDTAMTMMMVLIIPAALSAYIAVLLLGAKRARFAWWSLVPFGVAIILAYLGWFVGFR